MANWSEKVEALTDFLFLGCKITVDSDCSHEIKRGSLLGRKAMTNLDSILKSKDITLPTNICIVKAIVFPVVIYRFENWTIKKAEHQRTDVFELWCWIRLLRIPWTSRRSSQSILKEINPEFSMEGLMLNLKLQYFGHLMWKADSLEKTLVAGKDWRPEEKGMTGWDSGMASLTQWMWVWANSGRWWRTGKPGMLQSMVLKRDGHNWATEQQMSGRVIPTILGKWWRFPGIGPPPTSWSLMVGLEKWCL